MVTQVEIISRQMIKPSSPTPSHLKDLEFSFFDRTAVPIYTPFIFFYQINHQSPTHDTILLRLKRSLADTLTVFYPLAGRIQDNNASIECNDEGAEFIEARVHARLLNIIKDPNMEELRQYLPIQPHHHPHKGEKVVLLVQANLFDCGGLAVGVCVSHKITDGTSLIAFLKAWASTSRGEASGVVPPNFNLLAKHFPPGDLSRLDLSPSMTISSEKIMTRRFVFNNEKLEALKARITTAPGSRVKDPTRVEAISASIWQHFIEHNQHDKHTNNTTFATLHPVNIRPRMSPPLLDDQAFGNGFVITPAFVDPNIQDRHELHELAHQLRNAIRKIDDDYIKKIKVNSEEYYLKLCQDMMTISKQGMRLCNFSSWCRFPVYEVDHGWGEPIWVCTTPLPFKNLVILMGRAGGDGIEAWVNMLEHDMNTIEIE